MEPVNIMNYYLDRAANDETPSEAEEGFWRKRKDNILRLMRENRPLYNRLDTLMKFLMPALVEYSHLEKVKEQLLEREYTIERLQFFLREQFNLNRACEDIVAKITEFISTSDNDDKKMEDKFELLIEFAEYYPQAI